MPTIHEIVQRHAVEVDAARTAAYIKRHKTEPHRLAMSSLGGCIREAYLSAFQHADGHPLQRPPSHPFDADTLELFEGGRMYEEQLYRELCTSIDPGIIWREPPLGNGAWSGRPDFLIAPCGYFPRGAIIDCKGTGSYSFAYTQGRIPRLGDCLQVLAYRYFLHQETGHDAPAYLYYRGWRKWGEFEVDDDHEQGIIWAGHIGPHFVSGAFDTDLPSEMARMENWWDFANNGAALDDLSAAPLFFLPGYDNPHAVDWGCLRASGGKWWPRCRWLAVCWGDEWRSPGPFGEV